MPDETTYDKLIVNDNSIYSSNTVLFNNQLVKQIEFDENTVYERAATPETWTLPDKISTDSYTQTVNYPFWFKADGVIHSTITYSSVLNSTGTRDVTLQYDDLIAYLNGTWSTDAYKTIIFSDTTEYTPGLRRLLSYIGATKE